MRVKSIIRQRENIQVPVAGAAPAGDSEPHASRGRVAPGLSEFRTAHGLTQTENPCWKTVLVSWYSSRKSTCAGLPP